MAHRGDRDFFYEKPGLKEIASKSLYIQSKKFYLDVKENKRGKFIKFSEVAPNGQKIRIVMDMSTGGEFHDRLEDFIKLYSNLESGRVEAKLDKEGIIKSETIFRENRRYYLDMKQNFRGRFLKVSMTLPTHERCQLIIPGQGLVDVKDALAEILEEHGREDTSAHAMKDTGNSMHVENKTFFFDVGKNDRGTYLRISEVSGAFRTMVTVPEHSWKEFISRVNEATSLTRKEEDEKEDNEKVKDKDSLDVC